MSGNDLNRRFLQAEQAFSQKEFSQSLQLLQSIEGSIAPHPAILHLKALVYKNLGQQDESKMAFGKALALTPSDTQIRNNYANLLVDMGSYEAAVEQYELVLKANARMTPARTNLAIALHKIGDFKASRKNFMLAMQHDTPSAYILSAKASMESDCGDIQQSKFDYDQALELDERYEKALTGRSRLLLELGEEDCLEMVYAAHKLYPENPSILVSLAYARMEEGTDDPVSILIPKLEQNPLWSEGHKVFAQIMWESGQQDEYLTRLEKDVARHPYENELRYELCEILSGTDRIEDAEKIANACPEGSNGKTQFALMEANFASECGHDDLAQEIFDTLDHSVEEISLHKARHALRQSEPELAENFLQPFRQSGENPIAVWALTDITWRFLDNPKSQWLHQQTGLISEQHLELSESELTQIADRVRQIHASHTFPVGQSIRGGIQTRGELLKSQHPEITLLDDAIRASLQQYWDNLPPYDAHHPLLKWRDQKPEIIGSWSVKLEQGGFHVNHIHPNGLISSALYLAIPDDGDSTKKEGWLELGRPPKDLRIQLSPHREIKPVKGKINFFPSTCYHGTVPISCGERLSVAFDVNIRQ